MKILSSTLSYSRVTRRHAGHSACSDTGCPHAGAPRRSRLLMLAGLLALFVLPLASGFAGDTSNHNSGGFNPGTEGEGTLPATFDPGSGLVMYGSLSDIRTLVTSISGTGFIRIEVVDPESSSSPVLVFVQGNFHLVLDRQEMTNGAVDLYFSTGMTLIGGSARVRLDQDRLDPFLLNETSYPLPLAELCSSPAAYSMRLALEAVGLGLDRYGLFAQAHGSKVHLVQRASF